MLLQAFSHILNPLWQMWSYAGISLLTPVRNADYSCPSEKEWASLKYCIGNCLLITVTQITLSCKSDVSWSHPELRWRHLSCEKGSPYPVVQSTAIIFPSRWLPGGAGLLPDGHCNSTAALTHDLCAQLLPRVIAPSLLRFTWQCSEPD